MRTHVNALLLTLVIFDSILLSPRVLADDTTDKATTIADFTRGMTKVSSIVTCFRDVEHGKLWLLLPKPDERGECQRCLYVESLRSGLGSNPVGLDRGQLGASRVLIIRRLGNRVLFEVPNLRFRALSESEAERRAVAESFAPSILWGQECALVELDGRALVDLTGFVVRDAHDVSGTLTSTDQGSFALDLARSAVDFSEIHAFPKNCEFEAILTYHGSKPGRHVQATAAVGKAFTLVQHHSFIELPDADYTPRAFDPRCGAFATRFKDYAAPLTSTMDRAWVERHRLRKQDPTAPRSPGREPIVYYVDRAAPEPIRSALIEGASWWNQAFEAAGYIDAFRVELLPEGAHPLDVRYNVIEWVHRSTRGWSYGSSIHDPRTGEIIKGHVSLGSLRIRQDQRLFEGLAGVDKSGTGGADDPIELALARIRQLAAHEVGHTLGLAHNFAASTYQGRASVMDYPAPWVRAGASGLDFSHAYAIGVGVWDRQAIRYIYGDYADAASEAAGLAAILAENQKSGYRFITDADARPAGSAHPLAHLWDNGEDVLAELDNVMAVRDYALSHFGSGNVAAGQPLATLHEVFVPVYLYHRYQVEAAIKLIGGVDYSYSAARDAQAQASPVPAARQRLALKRVLETLQPKTLDISDEIVERLIPRPPGYGHNRELFGSMTGPVFDRLGVIQSAIDHVMAVLLDSDRLSRLVDQNDVHRDALGLTEMLRKLTDHCTKPLYEAGRLTGIRTALQRSLVDNLTELASRRDIAANVRAAADAELLEIRDRLQSAKPKRDPQRNAETRLMVADIEAHLSGQARPTGRRHHALETPPGSPIGCGFDNGVR